MNISVDLTNTHAYIICDKFVNNICQNRGSSHGYNHMKRVADLSIAIIEQSEFDLTYDDIQIIIACAWLHDVNDHKYHYENNLPLLRSFLKNNFFFTLKNY